RARFLGTRARASPRTPARSSPRRRSRAPVQIVEHPLDDALDVRIRFLEKFVLGLSGAPEAWKVDGRADALANLDGPRRRERPEAEWTQPDPHRNATVAEQPFRQAVTVDESQPAVVGTTRCDRNNWP